MNYSDPIADMLTRIRNAYQMQKALVTMPYSHIKEGIAKVLHESDFISRYEIKEESGKKSLLVRLKYINNLPAATALIRDSKPGYRQYGSPKKRKKTLKTSRPQHALVIWSTSQGILSEQEALKQNIGGEKLCTVW